MGMPFVGVLSPDHEQDLSDPTALPKKVVDVTVCP